MGIFRCPIDGFQYSNRMSFRWHAREQHGDEYLSPIRGEPEPGVAVDPRTYSEMEEALDPQPETIASPEPTESEPAPDLETGGGDFGGGGSSGDF